MGTLEGPGVQNTCTGAGKCEKTPPLISSNLCFLSHIPFDKLQTQPGPYQEASVLLFSQFFILLLRDYLTTHTNNLS